LLKYFWTNIYEKHFQIQVIIFENLDLARSTKISKQIYLLKKNILKIVEEDEEARRRSRRSLIDNVTMVRLFSVDCECVADGRGHNARALSLVAVVDENSKTVYKSPVAVTNVVSYLTRITGQKQGDLEGAPSAATVQAQVKALLGPDVLIVGQSVQSDLDWLKLIKGVDYQDSFDLADKFKAFNPKYQNYSHFSLQHEARTLLSGMSHQSHQAHDPALDAKWSMDLYRMFFATPNEAKLNVAKKKLISTRPAPSIAKQFNYQMDGICMAKFYPKMCICDDPTGQN